MSNRGQLAEGVQHAAHGVCRRSRSPGCKACAAVRAIRRARSHRGLACPHLSRLGVRAAVAPLCLRARRLSRGAPQRPARCEGAAQFSKDGRYRPPRRPGGLLVLRRRNSCHSWEGGCPAGPPVTRSSRGGRKATLFKFANRCSTHRGP